MACKRSKGSRRKRRGKKRAHRGGRRRRRVQRHNFSNSRIIKNRDFLIAAYKAKGKKAKRAIFKTCGPKEVCTLAEVAKNVLNGNIDLPEKTKGVLCKYKKALRALASKKISTKTKQKNITGKWLATTAALASIIGPWLYNKFKRK